MEWLALGCGKKLTPNLGALFIMNQVRGPIIINLLLQLLFF